MALCMSLQRMDSRIWPMSTRAHTPWGLPNAPRMPVCTHTRLGIIGVAGLGIIGVAGVKSKMPGR